MNRNQYTKVTEFKLLGFPVWEKVEACNEKNYDDEEVIQVTVRPDYFKSEFE